METEFKEPQKVNTALPNEVSGLDSSKAQTLANLPNGEQPDSQLGAISAQISKFITELPQDLNKFYSAYKTPLTGFAAFVASVVALKIVLAVLAAVNDIPLISPIFELIGIGYTGWFVFRYLLKAPTRKELGAEIDSFKKQIMGKNSTESLN